MNVERSTGGTASVLALVSTEDVRSTERIRFIVSIIGRGFLCVHDTNVFISMLFCWREGDFMTTAHLREHHKRV